MFNFYYNMGRCIIKQAAGDSFQQLYPYYNDLGNDSKTRVNEHMLNTAKQVDTTENANTLGNIFDKNKGLQVGMAKGVGNLAGEAFNNFTDNIFNAKAKPTFNIKRGSFNLKGEEENKPIGDLQSNTELGKQMGVNTVQNNIAPVLGGKISKSLVDNNFTQHMPVIGPVQGALGFLNKTLGRFS